EEFAFIDQLCGGRLDFGVGRGYQPAEFRAYGIPLEESRDRFAESLEIIKRAWTHEKFSFKGKHFDFQDVEVHPRPFQKPHPPFFGASFDPETIKYQAMQGMNLLFSPLLADSQKITEYKSVLREHGHDPADFRVGGLVFVFVDEDRDRALATFEEPCMSFYRTFAQMIPAREYPEAHGYYRYLHENLSTMVADYDAGRLSFREIVEEGPFHHGFIVGDPDSVKDKLQKLVEDYQLTDVLCWTRLAGLRHDRVMHSMDQLVNRVVRPLRESGAL
ncbi:MAG: LLM class flavin-dependent oxidoreductase, partial [Deltaproteobacteria bacterium]|nr:LLM class flavin-dependent oxidoreductase [Deltaproteobacteria bacterium]